MDLQLICQKVCDLAKTVSKFIGEEADKVEADDIITKYHNNLVSYVDQEAEKRIVAGLQDILPTAGFIVEEETVARSTNDYQWIVDPLDGTTNFLYNIPSYGVSIALTHKGKVVLGVVNEVNRMECFYAWHGGGAYLNGRQIFVSKTDKLKDALLSTGFPYYDFEVIDPYVVVLKQLMRDSRGIRRLGASAIDLCYVACGRYDGFFEHSLQPWDVAAGSIIVQEAGGTVCDFNGENNYIFGFEMVAHNGNMNNEFFSLIHKDLGRK